MNGLFSSYLVCEGSRSKKRAEIFSGTRLEIYKVTNLKTKEPAINRLFYQRAQTARRSHKNSSHNNLSKVRWPAGSVPRSILYPQIETIFANAQP